jgi:hypothetical protein
VEVHLQRLGQRIAGLGKHYQRFIKTIAANLDRLVERLEQHKMLDDVELWDFASSPGEQMRAIVAIGDTPQEKLDLMATFYSLQFLHMNLLALDRLELALSDGEGRFEAYEQFIESQGVNYQRLNAVYLDNLIPLFLEGASCPEYCFCVVGTRSDQDDVDIMVIHGDGSGEEKLNRALSKLTGEFFRRAGRLHLYVAERMGIGGFSHRIEDYKKALEKDMTDFVMICELLSAEPLLGSWNILSTFKHEVTDRFYGLQSRDKRYSVGFLRGLLGEMHSLMVQEVSRERIDFKNDALRLAKGMALAGKVVNNIREVQPVQVLDQLAKRLPRMREDLVQLKESYLFIETFRLLYHILVVQEEEVEFNGEEGRDLASIAAVMGFMEKGGVSAANQVVVRYFESVDRIRWTCRKLLTTLAEHVRKTSGYSYLAKKQKKRPRNVATELADSVRVFSGHIFFEDILAALKKRDGRLARKLVKDLIKLRGKRRDNVINSFLEFSASDPLTLIELVLTIHDVGGDNAQELFEAMVSGFLKRMHEHDTILPGLLSVYNRDPALINRFIEALHYSQRNLLETELNTAELWDEEQRGYLANLRKYIWLRTAGSEYYRRTFRKVINKYPHFIRHLDDADRLRRYASGFLAQPESGFDPEHIRSSLGDYYDVAYLSCAIEALKGAPLAQYRAAYVESVEKYINNLYSFCKRMVVRQTGIKVETKDLFAVMVSGGLARAQAFDDDFDLILILNSDAPSIFSHFRKMSASFHRELVRRGTLPQYRFGDHFGEFVTRFSQLSDWFETGKADTVDKTQLLGARLLVGSSRFRKLFNTELIEPFIFDRFDEFAQEMAMELEERNLEHIPIEGSVNVKDGPGGLRDIEQLLLILKAKYRLPAPISPLTFREISAHHEDTEALVQLQEHHSFLRRIRDLYRLGVAADDEIVEEELELIAKIIGISGEGNVSNGLKLAAMIKERMRRVRQVVTTVVYDLCGYRLSNPP